MKKQILRAFLPALAIVLCSLVAMGATDEYKKASEKDILNAKTVTARFDQITSDGYHYIYWLVFNAPRAKGDKPTVTIENPSLPPKIYTIERAAGSQIRKELWCKDTDGKEVRIILKYEEKPGARNATDLKLYVDSYPGKRANQQSIDATEVQHIYTVKDTYESASVLLSPENSMTQRVKNEKVATYPAIFKWMDANIPGI